MIPEARSTTFFFAGQAQHFGFLSVLLVGSVIVGSFLSDKGSFLGLDSWAWFCVCLVLPIVHQIVVWVVWRSELASSAISPLFGGRGFKAYGVIFALLIASRPITIFGLAFANEGTLPVSMPVAALVGGLLAIPAAYTFYSVERYFGFDRAIGGDHFDEKYRSMPLVKQGIFRFSSNSMYLFGFLILWAIAIAFRSQLALVIALFQHAYIWVHYMYTERPDMQLIYGGQDA